MPAIKANRKANRFSPENRKYLNAGNKQSRQENQAFAGYRLPSLTERTAFLCEFDEIERLYDLAKVLPTYKNREWNNENLNEVGGYLMQAVNSFGTKNKFTEVQVHHDILEYTYYYPVDSNTVYGLPINILESFEAQPFIPWDSSFYKLLLNFFTVFHKKTHIGIYNEGSFECLLNYLPEMAADAEQYDNDKERMELCFKALDLYSTGKAGRYLDCLNREIDYSGFVQQYHSFTPKDKAELGFYKLIGKGIEIMNTPDNLSYYYDTEGYGITPPGLIFLSWDNDDFFMYEYLQALNDGFNSGEEEVPLKFTYGITSKWKPEKITIPDYPTKILNFITEFNKYINEFRKHV